MAGRAWGKVDLTEKLTFKQELKEKGGVSHVDNWGKVLQAVGTAKINSKSETGSHCGRSREQGGEKLG